MGHEKSVKWKKTNRTNIIATNFVREQLKLLGIYFYEPSWYKNKKKRFFLEVKLGYHNFGWWKKTITVKLFLVCLSI